MTHQEHPSHSLPSGLDPSEWRVTTRALQRIARPIVGDTALSEDVVQGAWVHALEQRKGKQGMGWLRQLVRHRAIDVQRKKAARPLHAELLDTVASEDAPAEEVASRIETQRLLLDAVEELDTPYRVAIYLRYFDELPVREISERLGVPLKTVETRLSRAIAQLRESLGRSLRDPKTGRWAPALLAFCDPSSIPGLTAAASLTGSAAAPSTTLPAFITMKNIAITAFAAAILATGWFASESLATHAPTAPHGVGRTGADPVSLEPEVALVPIGEAHPRIGMKEPGISSAPSTSASTSIPGSGTLRVAVQWSDGQPAGNVGVVAVTPWDSGAGVRQRHRQVTGADGVALFSEIPSGPFTLCTDRLAGELGYDFDGEVPAEVLGGETVDVTLPIPEGLRVDGVVVDSNGAPVPDAGVWLTSDTGGWTAGAIVARTNADGAFTLRDVQGTPSLGALVPGHLPSPLVDMDLADKSSGTVSVELAVTPGGGALEGLVADELGQPIVGALVVVGDGDSDGETRSDMTSEEKWSARYATTGPDGRYSIDSLNTGTIVLQARRLGLAQWTAKVVIRAAETTQHNIVLGQGTEVNGVVTDSSGAPAVGARIYAFPEGQDESYLQGGQTGYRGTLAPEVAITDQDGGFVLERLPRQAMFLYAIEARPAEPSPAHVYDFARTEIDLTQASDHVWSPVFEDGRVISGVARYSDGEPIVNAQIYLTSTDPNAPGYRTAFTETGDFKFIQLPGASYSVTASMQLLPPGQDDPRIDNVVPDENPVELVADFTSTGSSAAATVHVVFVDTGARADGSAEPRVVMETMNRYMWFGGDLVDGVWNINLSVPGSYRPLAMIGDRVIAVGAPFEVAAGANVDLGTLVSAPGGTLTLNLGLSSTHPLEDGKLRLRHAGHRYEEIISLGNDPTILLENLTPGAGSVTLEGSNMVAQEIQFAIQPGEETVIDVPIIPAIGVPYRIHLPHLDEDTTLDFRFIDLADSSTVYEHSLAETRPFGNPIEWSTPLAPGNYRFEAELGNGQNGSTLFTVPSLDPATAPNPTITVE